MRRILFFLMALSLSSLTIGCSAAQDERPSAATPRTITARFRCDAGQTVQAVFTTGAESSVALSLSDGRQLVLPQVISGSGARYANRDESFVFWNKGDTAFIEEGGKTSYAGCRAER